LIDLGFWGLKLREFWFVKVLGRKGVEGVEEMVEREVRKMGKDWGVDLGEQETVGMFEG
jgi:hypothetical protein